MAVKFNDPKTIAVNENLSTNEMAVKSVTMGDIVSSTEINGIEIRMLSPYVRNNKTLKIWPFPGKAKLYCLTIVISDIANQLVGTMDLNTFSDVGDNEYLPVNKTIYYWQGSNSDMNSPNQVHIISSIIKSREGLRDVGNIVESVKEDDEYKTTLDKLSSIIAETATFSVVTNIAMDLAGIVGQYLGKVHDNPIGTVVQSFTRLHGDWDKTGVTPININTQNADFHFELIVRDNRREISNQQLTARRLPSMQASECRMISM